MIIDEKTGESLRPGVTIIDELGRLASLRAERCMLSAGVPSESEE